MATTSQRLAALEAWKTAHIEGHVLSGHTHGDHQHPNLALASHTHATEPPPVEPPPVEPPPVEPPPPPPPTGTNPSGQAMPMGDVPGWRQVFTDDFLTPLAEGQWPQGDPATDAKWDFYPSNWDDTSNNGWYGNQAISTHDSVMDMHLRWLNNRWQVAAPIPVPTGGIAGTSFRAAMRFKADPTIGFKTAWLLWPTSNVWPRDGEVDFPEGALQTTSIEGYMHRQGATVGSDQDWRPSGKPYTAWHTAVVEWVAGVSCSFYMDGTLLAPTMTSRVPNTPMRFVLQTETRLGGGAPPAGAQAHVLLDWIAVYRKAA